MAQSFGIEVTLGISGRLTPGSTESVRPGRKILTAADRRIGAPPAPPGTSQLPRPHTSRARQSAGATGRSPWADRPIIEGNEFGHWRCPCPRQILSFGWVNRSRRAAVYLPAAASKTRRRAAYGAGAPRPPEGHVPEPQRERATLRLHLSRRLSWTRNRFDTSARIFGVGAEWSGVRGELGCGHSASMAGSRLLL
jgi:hypothetical protein